MALPKNLRHSRILDILKSGKQYTQADIIKLTGYTNEQTKSALSNLRKRPNRQIHICDWTEKDSHKVAVYSIGDRDDVEKDAALASLGAEVDRWMTAMCRVGKPA